MDRKLIASLLSVSILSSTLAGCSGTGSAQSAAPAPTESAAVSGTRTITDMAGREVEIPAEIDSIATFGAVGVLNAFVELMGCGDKICNEMAPSFTKNDKWAMQYKFAPQIADGPVLENADREVLIEEVLKLKPDLCLTMTKSTAEELADKGLTCVYLSWSEVGDVKTAVELMGDILGKQDVAGDYITYFDDTVARAAELTSGLTDETRKTVLYGDVAGRSQPHMIAEWWIEAAGGISVTKDAHTEESLTYTTEDLLQWDPDVMLVTSKQADELKADSQLSGITAIRDDAIYYVPTVAHVWGNRTVEQPLTILWTLNKLYPDLYSTEELTQDVRDFYSHYFLYDMTDEEIAKIIGRSPLLYLRKRQDRPARDLPGRDGPRLPSVPIVLNGPFCDKTAYIFHRRSSLCYGSPSTAKAASENPPPPRTCLWPCGSEGWG
ncbi:ABC transporter substrate-binding protein [Pseudoflavonifractor sp. MSJ-37]|uniref:ABC transporter substrate-binding protein n=1 Tax=Pseudoflavonifractor sp. MSJ-37 TaxID=2841531 RepID=UPI0020A12098|nr:ABC transporter substrate-binding protein [Pseudoflavonifractor sp. MSJ-37]